MGKPVSSSSSGEEEEEESEDDMKEKEVPLDKVLKKVEKVNGPMQPIKEVDEVLTPTLNKTKILDETKDGLLNQDKAYQIDDSDGDDEEDDDVDQLFEETKQKINNKKQAAAKAK